jgi:hypothetical protein
MKSAFLLVAFATAPLALPAQRATTAFDGVGRAPRMMTTGASGWAGTTGWRLVLERTIQPGEGAADVLGNPTEVVLFADGRVAVAEDPRGSKTVGIQLFDAKGTFVRRLGRDGEGPGEYRTVIVTSRADTLVIQDQRLARVTFMGLDGKPLRTFPSKCCALGWPIHVDGRGVVTVASGDGTFAHFTAEGRLIDTIRPPLAGPKKQWITPDGARYGIPLAATTLHLALRDGSILYGLNDRQEFLVSKTGKDTVRIFGRTGVTARPAPDSLRRALIETYRTHRQVGPVFKSSDIPTTLPVWSRLSEDGDGNIWVLDGYSAMSPARQFDVYARDGRYLGAVAAPAAKPIAMSWSNGRVAILDNDTDDLPRVRVYRVDRNGK